MSKVLYDFTKKKGNDAERLKEEGMATVYEHTSDKWKEYVAKLILSIPKGTYITGEDIRLKCELQPHHPNAWGAIINAHVRSGELIATGQYKKPISPKSHARMIQIYQKT